ncbi:hypothetical protein [Nocardia aobensis]|uniref:hypothetical protein n=1 Tax=Nocardia aobensis TaxID=257277 RepID=UPI001FE14438|nr:hypothetical protein [Nocardia aobensis]
MFEDWPEEFSPSLRRTVVPAAPVVVHLGQAITTDTPTGFGRNKITMKVKAGGLRLTDDVPGLLHAWARVADGSWLGLVEMVLWTGNGHGKLPVTQWCPASAISPTQGICPPR